jgi:hypothetical protein
MRGFFTSGDLVIDTAVPAEHFAKPPYRAELFNANTGWAGVMNANGINCLTFADKPGATITDYETAKLIAETWNEGNQS